MELNTSAPELIIAASEPQPPRRKRDRRRSLTRIDMRSRLGKRIAELSLVFAGALGGSRGELSAVRKLKIEQAAQLMALAEQARGEIMRGVKGTSDIVRLERAAAAAVRALGELEPRPKPPTLAEILSQPRSPQ
jgi:hypothetical protein